MGKVRVSATAETPSGASYSVPPVLSAGGQLAASQDLELLCASINYPVMFSSIFSMSCDPMTPSQSRIVLHRPHETPPVFLLDLPASYSFITIFIMKILHFFHQLPCHVTQWVQINAELCYYAGHVRHTCFYWICRLLLGLKQYLLWKFCIFFQQLPCHVTQWVQTNAELCNYTGHMRHTNFYWISLPLLFFISLLSKFSISFQ